MPLETFHPIIQRWFAGRFAAPTEPQTRGWPPIAAGRHTLIAAPTGSGKTLTAFLAVIDRLLRQAIDGELPDEMRVVYVSPLRALSNDMHRNLEVPLAEIIAQADSDGFSFPQIRVGLRTGDTPSHRRTQLVKHPPHILVTTPESLYLMLTAEKSRAVLRSVETLIVDEIHALVRDKRGSHLSLSVERLAALTGRPLQRIGLSATQKPIERMAEFLVGVHQETGVRRQASAHGANPKTESAVAIVNVGHARDLDLAIETPPSELSAVCSHEQWAEVNARLVELIQAHRSTLIFVNTRKMAERVTHQLTQLLGEDVVGSHHGSLAADLRLDTERRLKSGQLKAVVATASLELGIDIGYIDLVVQIGSPRSIATFLQRIGRSGHALGLTPKGRLFAVSRDELLECMGLVRAIGAGRLDATPIPEAPLDVLAQQIVAETAARDWSTDDLFALFTRAYPYRNLSRREFDETIRFLGEGVTSARGRTHALLHHDAVNRRIRARRGARLAAISNGGAIPETDSVRVVLEPEHTVVGSVDEEFGVESDGGDIFLLGNTSWRIQQLRGNDLLVTDAHGAPPTIPFWQGEAPGRTIELSQEVSQLREDLERRIIETGFGQPPTEDKGPDGAPAAAAQAAHPLIDELMAQAHCARGAAEQALVYVAAEHAAIGLVPSQQRVVFERFFDESGGMQLVVHAPFGTRINKGWGLAMRKRFCRSFDFELQATADDDGFILSLGPQHSFPIESLFPMLRPDNVRNLLEQALLAVPMFHVRWRWNATRALLVARSRNGKKVPPAIQRFRSEDLLTAVFPKLTGCQENITGDHELPDHPLVRQTMEDCLHEALDIDGLVDVLERIERGEITLIARDTREPSPFAYELLNSNPYAFLDGGEIQERRARAVATRRSLSIDSVRDLGKLDPEAIAQVVSEAQPLVRNADELHDVLLSRLVLPAPPRNERTDSAPQAARFRAEPEWESLYRELADDRRAVSTTDARGRVAWVATERWPAVQAMFPDAAPSATHPLPDDFTQEWSAAEARTTAARGLLEVSGPTTAAEVADILGVTLAQAAAALEALEGEGSILRGRFREQDASDDSAAESVVANPPASPGDEAAESALDHDDSHERPAAAAITPDMEWCHRRLLSRIHRLTMAGLRREIEPVDVGVYQRYLHQLHGVARESRRTGPNGLFDVVSQLQGLDVPAVCWERDVLSVRCSGYKPEWLDELCLTGEVAWGRLYPPTRTPEKSRPMASITRVAPVSLFLREDRPWLVAARPPLGLDVLSSTAQSVLERLLERGAMFPADLMSESRLLPTQLDEALGELVVRGFITSDGIAGLRSLVRTSSQGETKRRAGRNVPRVVRRRRSSGSTGRWSVWPDRVPNQGGEEESMRAQSTGVRTQSRRNGDSKSPDALTAMEAKAQAARDERERRRELAEQWAWQLLRRWGVVFKDLLRREAGAPSWFELLQVYRRLEARGEIRGGRFVKGVAGEQFSLGETIRVLRRLRDQPPANEVCVLATADPLNLVGIITSGARIPRSAGNRIAFVDGRPVAARQSGELSWLDACPDEVRAAVLARLQGTGSAVRPAADGRTPVTAAGTPANGDPPQAAATGQPDAAADEKKRSPRRTRRDRPAHPSGIPRPIIS